MTFDVLSCCRRDVECANRWANMVDNRYESSTIADVSTKQDNAILFRLRAASRRSTIFNFVAYIAFFTFIFAAYIEVDGKPFWTNSIAWSLLPASVLLAFLGFRAWRCPSCKKLLGGTTDPTFCPECGIRYLSTIDTTNAATNADIDKSENAQSTG